MTGAIFDLTGKVALVTGGNGGIGRAIALALADHGASVAILGRDASKNRTVLHELEAKGAKSIAVQADISDRGQSQPAVDQVERALGPLDILVNNAGAGTGPGVPPAGRLLADDLELAQWDQTFATNLTGPLVLSKYAVRAMVERSAGKIVNISTALTNFGFSGPAYAASKAALDQLTRAMAFELAPHNVQVNGIAPGLVDTEMTSATRNDPERFERSKVRIPMKRWAQPEEIAAIAVFLASPASSFVTGVTILADGGLRLG